MARFEKREEVPEFLSRKHSFHPRRHRRSRSGLHVGNVGTRDSLLGVKLPFIELHLSNTFAREKFRHHSYFSDIAVGCIVGLGAQGYELAVLAAAERIRLQADARPAR